MIPKNTDLLTIETGLSEDERREAVQECRRLKAIDALGDRWLLSPNYSGHYEPELMPTTRS